MTEANVKSSPHLVQQMLHAVDAVHGRGILHGDLALPNFVRTPDQKGLWLLDFADSTFGDLKELAAERKAFVDHLHNSGCSVG